MAILLLDLSPEVLHLILFHSALLRRTRRALRLRLVCKAFDAALPGALFETRLMDDACGIGTMTWHLRAPYADGMWHEYLVLRTIGETDPAVGRFCEVRRVAELARKEMSKGEGAPVPALRKLVERLCWLLLRQTVRGTESSDTPADWNHWGPMGPKKAFPPDVALLPLSLLSVAAYLNLPALAQRLLDEGYNPNHHTFLFAPAMQTAAQAGHSAMLERLRRPGYPNIVSPLEGRMPYRVMNNWALEGATIRGDLAFLREVLTHEVPSALPRPINPILGSRCRARTRAIYDCLGAAVSPGPGPALVPFLWELEHHARHGHRDMVAYLADLGLPLVGNGLAPAVPLAAACLHSHWDVVALLLARGAPPNHPCVHGPDPQYAIHARAVANSVSAARLLLDHGADPNRAQDDRPYRWWPFPLLWHAFVRENTALVRLLVARGARLDVKRGKVIDTTLRLPLAEALHHLGLESMEEEFHRHFGFRLEPGTPYPVHWRKGLSWHRWEEARVKRDRILAKARKSGCSEDSFVDTVKSRYHDVVREQIDRAGFN